jgi:hypothetical protein
VAGDTIYVHGLAELVRAFRKLDDDLRREIQKEIQQAAEIVSDETRRRAERYGGQVASKIRPRVRGSTGIVESRAKSRGLRPNFGPLLIRTAFLPALASKQAQVVARLDEMLARLGGDAGF